MDPLVKDALIHWRTQAPDKKEWVFGKPDGSPYRSIRTAFRTACKRAGLKHVSPHVLRHTFASMLVLSGAPLRTVQDLGGWKVLAIVSRYGHLDDGHRAAVIGRIPLALPAPLPTSMSFQNKPIADIAEVA